MTTDMLELLALIPRLGIRADERELLYQLKRRQHPAGNHQSSLFTALADLETQGLIVTALAAELTDKGKRTLNDACQAPEPGTWYPWPTGGLDGDDTTDRPSPPVVASGHSPKLATPAQARARLRHPGRVTERVG